MPQIGHYPYNIICRYLCMNQIQFQEKIPEPEINMVERIPVKGENFSKKSSWEDFRGLSWLLIEDWR